VNTRITNKMRKTKYRKLKPKYSGKDSIQFWNTINSDEKHQKELYSLGCILQELEGYVLERVNKCRITKK